MTLSAYAIIAVLLSLDATAFRDQLGVGIRPRLVGGFLAGLAVLFFVLNVGRVLVSQGVQ